jgi:hypothetical protein
MHIGLATFGRIVLLLTACTTELHGTFCAWHCIPNLATQSTADSRTGSKDVVGNNTPICPVGFGRAVSLPVTCLARGQGVFVVLHCFLS